MSHGPPATSNGTETRTQRVARLIETIMAQQAAPQVLARAKAHVLDTLGAAISGMRLPAGQAISKYLRETQSAAVATVVASGSRASLVEATMANAIAAHADETDDAHPASITHPGCSVVPSALAMAEHTRASGLDTLKAVIAGYELCGRVGMALGGTRFLTQRGFDPHAFGGTFGAAAAAGALGCRRPGELAYVLSYAAQQASGLATVFRDPHHIEKAFVFAGMPARNGMTAALLVRAGLPAVADVLDTKTSFLSAFQIDDEAARLIDQSGEAVEITRTNIKRWSVGSPAQAILDSLEALLADVRFGTDDVMSIDLYLPFDGARVVDNSPMPSVCVQHLAALMIIDGTVGFASSHDHDRMHDPSLLALRKKIALHADEALTRAQPARQGIVEVLLRDGRRLRHHTREVRGTWANPMSMQEVATKVRDLVAPVLGSARADDLISCVERLEQEPDVSRLMTIIA